MNTSATTGHNSASFGETLVSEKSQQAKEFWSFVDRVRSSGMPSHARHVALEVWLHMRPGKMVSSPSVSRIVANTGLSERTVQNDIRLFKDAGLFDIETSRGGAAKTHIFTAINIAETAHELHRLMNNNGATVAPFRRKTPQEVHRFDNENPAGGAPFQTKTPQEVRKNPAGGAPEATLEATKKEDLPPTPLTQPHGEAGRDGFGTGMKMAASALALAGGGMGTIPDNAVAAQQQPAAIVEVSIPDLAVFLCNEDNDPNHLTHPQVVSSRETPLLQRLVNLFGKQMVIEASRQRLRGNSQAGSFGMRPSTITNWEFLWAPLGLEYRRRTRSGECERSQEIENALEAYYKRDVKQKQQLVDEECFFENGYLRAKGAFADELRAIIGPDRDLQGELDKVAVYIGTKTPATELRTNVRGRVKKLADDRRDQDQRYLAAVAAKQPKTKPTGLPPGYSYAKR